MDRRHQAHKAHDQGANHSANHSANQDATPDPEVLRLISEVESQLQGLKRVHAEREQTKAQLDGRQAELESRAVKQKEIDAALAAREEAARRAAETVAQRQAEIDRLAADLAEIEKDSKARIARAAEERQAVDTIASDLGVREKALADRSARFDQLQADLRNLKHRLAETERTAAERAEELLRNHDETAELAKRLHDAEQGRPAFEKQTAALRAELERATQTAQQAQAELTARQQAAAELTERCTALEQRLAEQERDRAASGESASELQSRLDAGAQAIQATVAERDHARDELARREKDAAELQSRCAAAAETIQKAVAERDHACVELAGHQQHAADLQARLSAAAKETKQAAAARDETAANLAKATTHAQDLTARINALQEQAEAARRQAAARGSRVDAGQKLRRKRMRRCRTLLRERSNKIRQASEMLKARHQQYEQVLSMRGEVITAKRAVDALQKKVQTAAARTRAATAIFYLSGLIAVLGVLSWSVTRQLVPATYVAKAVVVPEARNRTLSDVELANWQSYHENLLGDPQFLEIAAERMGRRGIATLATPGDLRAEFEKSFDFQSSHDGELVLELRGLGDDRTQRILDTYVTALVSQANAGKDRRTDGAATTILQPAKAVSTPIEDPRPLYAAGLLGGSTVVFLIIGGLIWGRLAAAKTKFETEARIDEFVESPDWPAAKAAG